MINFSFFLENITDKVYGTGQSDINQIVINSKEISPGDCFIGLVGAKNDGSDFFFEALQQGAAGIIVNYRIYEKVEKYYSLFPNVWFFFVSDTKEILMHLAKAWRKKFTIPILGITGSAGKTTTKELIKSLCENAGMNVCASKLSQNGTIGLPISILSLNNSHDIGIFEVGIQKPGEMDILISILQEVDFSIITTVFESHITFFKNQNKVLYEKLKLQSITKKCLFIDEVFSTYASINCKVIPVGKNLKSDVYYFHQEGNLFLVDNASYYALSFPFFYHTGFHHCISFAFAFGLYVGISIEIIRNTILNFNRVEGRFSVSFLPSKCTVVNDSYNACSPEVVLASIRSFNHFLPQTKKIVVLGDMLEQGELSSQNHKKVIYEVDSLLKTKNFEKAFFIGANYYEFVYLENCQNLFFFKTFEEAFPLFSVYLDDSLYSFLFKSSRGTKFYDYYLPKYIFLKK